MRCLCPPGVFQHLVRWAVENIFLAKDVENIMLAKPLLSQILGPVRTLKDTPPRLDTQL